jgi:geranylgeranyl pyrophosphate synthase
LLQRKKKSPEAAYVSELLKAKPLAEAVDPFACVAQELELVEKNLVRSIRSAESTLTDIAAHIICGGGKRLRPMIALLAFKAFGGKKVEDHDDIIDGAETRRGKESAFKKFGLKSTLVAGDFLFIKAFEFAGKFDDTVVQWTADACTRLTEGEILQGHFNRNTEVTLDDYLEIVKRKTASLFQTGAKIGIYQAGGDQALVDEMDRYGLNLGIAFQMIDDVLDVVGHKELLGKPTGIDLRDGNPSLPIILALRAKQGEAIEAFKSSRPGEAEIQSALTAIGQGPAIEEARELSRAYAQRALGPVKKLPPSLYRNALKTLIQLIVERNF